ncbi:MAG: hypothetical protein DWQ07_04790 [Chloroflexi bacterium]|nr:MAG: hypothetical protein DWQ07_04790 [Chloroflexota bacterium]MBL1194748.1 hypothetical protein [Chloroflexota bacterium]NOH12040.1 hypothetical protein [Chloroflexota bacterium]
MTKKIVFHLALLIILAACNGTNGMSEEEAIESARLTLEAGLTQNAPQEQAQAPAPAEQEPPPEAAAPTLTETLVPLTPTITLTPTSSIPTAAVSVATNCRSGPGVAYGLLDVVNPGQSVVITAQTTNSNYVLVQAPGGGPDCWLWLQHATISGNIGNLPLVTPPPSPTPTLTPTEVIDWTGAWQTDSGNAQFVLNITQSGNTITATEVVNAITLTINAALSPDGRTATGAWVQDNGISGTFVWQMLPGSTDQFNGNWVTVPPPGANYWCGFRNGAGYPNPCAGP